MPKCPNCGLEAARTEDWACQWCGYPLLLGPYKKLPKTYKQLKKDIPVDKEPVISENAISTPSTANVAPISESELHPEPDSEREIEPELERKPEPRPVQQLKPEPKQQTEPEPEAEPVAKLRPEPVLVPEPIIKLAPSADSSIVNLTIEELNTICKMDESAVHGKIGNRKLRITGVVDKIFIRRELEIYYIILTSPVRQGLWDVRCSFSLKNESHLTKLSVRQTVTVQGEYEGYKKNILLSDCTLVS